MRAKNFRFGGICINAVIMAGGRGKRLMPLTNNIPKPMVEVGGVPAMTRILRLLCECGINEAAVTLGYLADEVEKYYGDESCGIKLRYYKEENPLGTAGGVKAVSGMLHDEFVVISGDAVCEFDLASAAKYHKEKNADVTILLAKRSDPFEYGVVRTDGTGAVTGFCEKPSLSSVFSDLVNSGVYIMSSKVLDFIPEDVFYDFGHDVFPAMLAGGGRIFGYEAKGYWCDIGSPEAYLEANMHYSDGESVISPRAEVKKNCKIRRSVISEGAVIGEGCELCDTVICPGVKLMNNVVCESGVVIGGGSVIGEGARIAEGTVTECGARIGDGMIYRNTAVFRGSCEDLFSSAGPELPRSMFSSVFSVRLGAALAYAAYGANSSADTNKTICLMSSGGTAEDEICSYLSRGIRFWGGELILLGHGFESSAAAASVMLDAALTIHVGRRGTDIVLSLYDGDGLYPKREFERSVASAMTHDDNLYRGDPVKPVRKPEFTNGAYYAELVRFAGRLSLFPANVRRVNEPSMLLSRALYECGSRPTPDAVTFFVSNDGFSLSAVEGDLSLDFDHIRAILIKNGTYKMPVPMPCGFPNPGDLGDIAYYSHCPSGDGEDPIRSAARGLRELRDGCFAAAALARLMHESEKTLAELYRDNAPFCVETGEYRTGGDPEVAILSELGEPGGDGVCFDCGDGAGVRVVAKRGGYALTSHARNEEYAAELMDLTKKKIGELLRRTNTSDENRS